MTSTDATRRRPLAAGRRDYSAIMRCEAGDHWIPEARSQIEAWLREKDFDVSLLESADHQRGETRLMVRADIRQGHGDIKITLVEPGAQGTWRTDLIAHDEPGHDDWISITVSNDQGRYVAVPRVARRLMDILPLRDGLLELEDTYRALRAGDVDELVEALADDGRHGLVFVAGSTADAGIPFDAWASKVTAWSKDVSGLAKVFVLDPAATTAFQEQVGTRFDAPAWSIRTYQPGVNFDDPTEARRHRILGTRRLGSEPDHVIRRLLGDIARQQAATRPSDPSVLRVRRRFDRLENQRLVEVLAATEPVAAEPEEFSGPTETDASAASEEKTQLALVRRILGLKQITERALSDLAARITRRDDERRVLATLQERIETLHSDVEVLQDENQALLETLEDAQLEAEVALLDVDNRDAKIRYLTSRLKEQGDYESEYAEVPDEFFETRAETFDELLERVGHLEGVKFTGDEKEVTKLDQVDTNGAALRVAWDAVLVLVDYARARREGACDQGLDQYIRHTPSGYRPFPKGKFAETETRETMRQFGSERCFPVPLHVCEDGQLEMKAHFKLARIGMVSPRMHIYDAHPNDPTVYIGYIGGHLTNTQSN